MSTKFNILFIADPNLIHDVRWIQLLGERGYKCYLIPRIGHYTQFVKSNKTLPKEIILLDPILDPSTIRPVRTFFQSLRIRKAIKQFDIRLLHIMYAEPNALWINWKSLFGIPVVLTSLGTDILKTIPSFFTRKDWLSRIVARQYKSAFRHVDFVTCTSYKQAEVVGQLFGNERVMIVRTGVDFSLITKSNDDVTSVLGIKKPFMLMPRNMKPIYNHELTIGAITLLSETMKKNYRFVFLNKDTQEQAYFEKIVAAAKNSGAEINFLPSLRHADVIALYKKASLVIMNPFSDGSPVTAMEAMACKVPVILPPLEYDKQVFANAFYFPEWSPLSLKRKIEEVLLMDRRSMLDMLEKNYQDIKRLGDTQSEIRKLEDIYKNLVYR